MEHLQTASTRQNTAEYMPRIMRPRETSPVPFLFKSLIDANGISSYTSQDAIYHVLSHAIHLHHYLNNIIIASPLPSPLSASPPFGFPIGLVAAKNKTLIAMANPACSANTTMSKTLLVLASVVLSTGYKLRSKKKAENARPSATKT
jgi:hypothetical protein